MRCTATVETTSMPSSADSRSTSIRNPRAAASSAMLSARVKGTPASASWAASRSPRRRFFASHTWRQTYSGSFRRMSRVTCSSSDMGSRLFVPGVSRTCHRPPEISAEPLVTSTVVPG